MLAIPASWRSLFSVKLFLLPDALKIKNTVILNEKAIEFWVVIFLFRGGNYTGFGFVGLDSLRLGCVLYLVWKLRREYDS